MSQNKHGQIGHKLKWYKYTLKAQPDSKGSDINTESIEYVTKTFVK